MNRRKFIRQAATGMALPLVGNPFSAHALNSEKIRIGIIGYNVRGQQLAGILSKIGQVQITHICDPAFKRVAAFLSLDETPVVHSDYRCLLADKSIDAVLIATPDYLHTQIAVEACRAGKPVYLETPACHTNEEIAQLLEVMEETGVDIQVGLQHRSDPAFLQLKKEIENGLIGVPTKAVATYVMNRRSGWRAKRAESTPAIIQEGIHELDCCRMLLGLEMPQQVRSSKRDITCCDPSLEVPDTQTVDFTFPEITVCWRGYTSYTQDCISENRHLTIEGTMGILDICLHENSIRLTDLKTGKSRSISLPGKTRHLPEYYHLTNFVDKTQVNAASFKSVYVSEQLIHAAERAHIAETIVSL